MFTVGDEKQWSTTAASAVWAACSMLTVRRQRKPSRRFVYRILLYKYATLLVIGLGYEATENPRLKMTDNG